MRNALLILCGMALMALVQAAPQITLESLDARVTALERRLSSGVNPGRVDAPEWSMSVESIRLIPKDPEMAAAIAKLRSKADEMERGATASHHGGPGEKPKPNKAMLDRAKDLRSEADRMQRQLDTPRHEITGKNDMRDVRLITDRDLTGVISKLQPGTCITWRGTRVSMTEIEEEFTVTSVSVCERPEG